MANSKLLLALIAIALLIVGVRSDSPVEGEIGEPEASGSALRLEIEGLRSKISALESSIEDRIHEVKAKEDNIACLDGLIQEKLSKIASLESEIESLQNMAVDAKKLTGKADGRVGELVKQISELRTDIEAQSKKRDALATRASEAEKKVQVLNLKFERLQNTNEEQKLRIIKSQRALEVAEEELLREKLEATSKMEELTKVHRAWLPPWPATHLSLIQDLAVTHWNEHAKPSLVLLLHKALGKLEQMQIWAEPHFNTAKTEWIPAAKGQLLIFESNAEPYSQKISTRTFELYEETKSTIGPHIVKLQEVADPYFQEAKEFSKPYINQVVTVSKPHVEKVQLVLMPYKKHVERAYRKSLRTARTYHRQASALLAFPIFFLYRVLAAVFCKKAKKPRRAAHASHTHWRPKRRHVEN